PYRRSSVIDYNGIYTDPPHFISRKHYANFIKALPRQLSLFKLLGNPMNILGMDPGKKSLPRPNGILADSENLPMTLRYYYFPGNQIEVPRSQFSRIHSKPQSLH